MATIMDAESTLTDRYQTTIPERVRTTLGLGKRDRLHYSIQSDGTVLVSKSGDDPALAPFLRLLADDIAAHPERLQPIPQNLATRMGELIGDIEVELDAPLAQDPDDE